MTLLLVLAGAAVGAPARWLVDRAVSARHDSAMPWGTMTVNVLGSFVLGLVLSAAAMSASPSGVALLGTGFCGAFTTFSTFAFESVRLVESGSTRTAFVNVGLSLALGMAGVTLGWWFGTLLP